MTPPQRPTILAVDDNRSNLLALEAVLGGEYTLLLAESGPDALWLLRKKRDVAVILLDVQMPEMDGYETARAIRAMPRFDALPIIQLTAKAMKGDRDKSISAGASDYVTKPVDVEQLLSLMRVWLHR